MRIAGNYNICACVFSNLRNSDRAEKRLRMRVVDSFWRIFDRLISERLAPVPDGDSLAITSFDKMELDEF